MARRRARRKDQGDVAVGIIVLIALGGAGAWRVAESSLPLVLAVAAAVGVVLMLIWRRARAARRRTETTLGGFLALSPTAFETEVARVLEAAGFRRMQRVGGAGTCRSMCVVETHPVGPFWSSASATRPAGTSAHRRSSSSTGCAIITTRQRCRSS